MNSHFDDNKRRSSRRLASGRRRLLGTLIAISLVMTFVMTKQPIASAATPVGLMPAAGYSNVVLNNGGGLEAFLVGQDQRAYHKWCCWSGWQELPGGTFRPGIVVAKNLDATMEAFAVGTDMRLYHSHEQCVSCGWTGWSTLGGVWPGHVAVGRNGDGRLQVFLRGQDANLYTKWQLSPGGGWSDWRPIGGWWHHDPVVGQDADGRLEVFIVGDDKQLYDSYQTVVNGGFSAPRSLGGSWPGQPAVARNADGRLDVFLRGDNAAMYHARQTCAGCGFTNWMPLSGSWHHEPAVQMNADGRLQLFAAGDDNGLYSAWQLSPDGNWSGWRQITTSLKSDPTAARTSDRRIDVFYLAPDGAGSGALFHVAQVAQNANFGSVQDLGGQWLPRPPPAAPTPLAVTPDYYVFDLSASYDIVGGGFSIAVTRDQSVFVTLHVGLSIGTPVGGGVSIGTGYVTPVGSASLSDEDAFVDGTTYAAKVGIQGGPATLAGAGVWSPNAHAGHTIGLELYTRGIGFSLSGTVERACSIFVGKNAYGLGASAPRTGNPWPIGGAPPSIDLSAASRAVTDPGTLLKLGLYVASMFSPLGPTCPG